MLVENNVPLQSCNTLGIVARAQRLLRIRSAAEAQALAQHPEWLRQSHFVLGGGSNIVLTGDVQALVLKIEIPGRRLLELTEHGCVVEAGAGENWADFVDWTVQQGWPGLENLALIPGTVGAAPVQNIGAYGIELQDRFESLQAVDLHSGALFTLNAAQCGFGYRDSVFKHVAAGVGAAAGLGLAGRALIVSVRFRLPRPWRAELGYLDLQRKSLELGQPQPQPQQVLDWVKSIRRAKLPDPRLLGNAGSFFKNPTVSPEQCQDIIARDPRLVYYPLPDGRFKLAAGWLIDACGWRGKTVGNAAVHDRQALVLVNRGGATGGEVLTLARAIQTSVYERFGIRLEPEPVLV